MIFPFFSWNAIVDFALFVVFFFFCSWIRLRLDVEDHAAKVSVEEQMQITTINTLEKDLDHG